MRGVRTRQWKYIHYPHGDGSPDRHKAELYNLKDDPLEMRNLIDDPKLKEIVADLKKELARQQEETGGLPDKISIYRLPLEDEFGDDPELLEREIRITVLHELGHYFGIEEDRIAELGYE